MSLIPEFGRLIRGFSGHSESSMISQPRLSYTFFATFHINPDAPIGNLQADGIDSGRLFTALKSIGKPSVEFEIERLKSYNANYLVNKKATYKDVPLVFFDDSTSMVRGLIKAYRAYYSYAGNKMNDTSDLERYPLGTTAAPVENVNAPSTDDGNGGTLVSPVVVSASSNVYGQRTNNLDSMGMRLQAKPFFEKIKIYDLGSEPNSVNVYTLINPKFTNIESGVLDYSSVSLQEVQLTIAYEDYNEEIGVQLNDVLKDDNFFNQLNDNVQGYTQRTGNFNSGSGTLFDPNGTGNTTDTTTVDTTETPTVTLLGGQVVEKPDFVTVRQSLDDEYNNEVVIDSTQRLPQYSLPSTWAQNNPNNE